MTIGQLAPNTEQPNGYSQLIHQFSLKYQQFPLYIVHLSKPPRVTQAQNLEFYLTSIFSKHILHWSLVSVSPLPPKAKASPPSLSSLQYMTVIHSMLPTSFRVYAPTHLLPCIRLPFGHTCIHTHIQFYMNSRGIVLTAVFIVSFPCG